MRFEIMTLFPELVDFVLSSSIIGRAQASGAISVTAHNIRDYSEDKHRRVDDTPYGGGMGMLMAAPPIAACHDAITAGLSQGESVHTVYMSPQGAVLTQKTAVRLSKFDTLIILCGHYEGVDERVIEEFVDEEISVGDYVLTGGELPACILVDAVARNVPGVLSADECYELESFSAGLLEYPQYTRPPVFRGRTVPEVLTGGNHTDIERFRNEKALERTRKKRPDLIL
jgi:tRNA (guanine-N1)-methyltransferase